MQSRTTSFCQCCNRCQHLTKRNTVPKIVLALNRCGFLILAMRGVRDLVRAHLDAVHALRRARQKLSGFLLRQDEQMPPFPAQ